jgi:hypothetical protein
MGVIRIVPRISSNSELEIGERQERDQGSFSEIREHNSLFVRGSEDVVIALVFFRETRFGVSGDREEEPEERDHPHGTPLLSLSSLM